MTIETQTVTVVKIHWIFSMLCRQN